MLTLKSYIPRAAMNGNGTAKGSWIFDQFDTAGVLYIDELFLYGYDDVVTVTNFSEVKFKRPIHCFGSIEIYCKCTRVTPARIDITMQMMHRQPKTENYELAAESMMSFTVLKKENFEIYPLPKEIIDKVKSMQ